MLITMYSSLLSQMRKFRIKVVFRNSHMVLSNSCYSRSQVAHSALYNTTYMVLSVPGLLSFVPFLATGPISSNIQRNSFFHEIELLMVSAVFLMSNDSRSLSEKFSH